MATIAVLGTIAAPALIVLTGPAFLGSMLGLSGRRGVRWIGAFVVVLAATGSMSLLLVFADTSGSTNHSPTPAPSGQF